MGNFINLDLDFCPSTLVELLRWRALHQSQQRAFTFLIDGEDNEVHWTYEDLDRKARAIAAAIQNISAKGERALLLYPPGLDYIAGFLGCLYAGVIAVPAYPPHPSQLKRTLPRLQAIVKDAQVTLALTTKQVQSMVKLLHIKTRFSESIGKFRNTVERLTRGRHESDDTNNLTSLKWIATDNIESGLEDGWKESKIATGNLAFLQYTSGSTGLPKGVMVSHGNLLHNSTLICDGFEFNSDNEVVSWLPIYHDMGLIGCVLQPLCYGFPARLMSPLTFLRWPQRWLQVISDIKEKSVISGGPNFAYELCARKIKSKQLESLDLSNWKLAFCGAEPIRPETIQRFTTTFESCGFNKKAFYPCYGLAEATLFVSGGLSTAPHISHQVKRAELEKNRVVEASSDNEDSQTLVGCGQALLDQTIIIVEPQSLTRCSPDQIGEIWVSSASVTQGYWNRPDETAQTFQAYVADTGEGPFLRTGDLGYLHNGELFVTGRLKDLIIIRGRNHYPQDIELTVEQSHTALRPGCCAAFSVDVKGEERLVVVQEVRPRKSLDLQEVIANIRQSVTKFHELQIYALVLIKPRTIPKTSSGKIRRRVCRAGFLDGTLEEVKTSIIDESTFLPEDGGGFFEKQESPTRETLLAMHPQERQPLLEFHLKELVAQVLRVSLSQLDSKAPLNTLGLDSLMAVDLTHEIESNLDVTLSMASLLEGATISEITSQVLGQLSEPLSKPTATLARTNGAADHPLSHGQRAMWFQHQLAPESIYNIVYAVRIRSAVDIPALRQAFQTLVNRHPALRATFTSRHGEPVQQLREHVEVAFNREDASAWTEEQLHNRLNEDAYRPFDLERGPLLRVNLYSRSVQEHILLLSAHHIIVDLWSLTVLMNELSKLYSAGNGQVSLPALKLHYSDYVRWQSELLSGAEGERLWSYWQKKLSDGLPLLNLPTDRPRPSLQTFRGASESLWLSAELTGQLRGLGKKYGTTLYMTLLAAFKVLLYRYSGQEDLVVGSPTTGRSRAELGGIVGYFVNPVALRSKLSGKLTFRGLLGQVQQTVLEALEHQDYPFSLLVERLQPERDASRSPLFQVMFILQKATVLEDKGLSGFALGEEGIGMELGGLSLESLALERRVAPFDLTLMMAESQEGLVCSMYYNTDLYTGESIRRMLGHFHRLLESIVETPDELISRLPLLTGSEQQRLLVELNDTLRDYPAEACIHELFEAQVERAPEAVAVTYEDVQLTYVELNRRANQLAHYLQKLGVGPEALVGICVERSVEMIVGVLGVLKAGGAYLPLDPAYPQERLAFMLEDSQAAVLLTQQRLAAQLTIVHSEVSTVCLDTDWKTIAHESETPPVSGSVPENLAYVIYTSGSTGRPKGTMLHHRGLCNLVAAQMQAFGVKEGDKVLQFSSLSFDAFVWETVMALVSGATFGLASREILASGQGLLEVLRKQRTTVVTLPPSMLSVLPDEPLPDLQTLITAGEKCSGDLVEKWSVGRRFFNAYGPTETTVCASMHLCTNIYPMGPPIGRPIDNMEIYLFDSHLQPVPVGVAGELHIGGVGLARGYLNRPGLTAEKFIPNPFLNEQSARLYKSGDLARYLPDGNIEYLGRIDHQVKVRGFRIELGEIESVLREFPSVHDVVVLAREDVVGDRRLVAYLVPQNGLSEEIGELRDFLTERLPEYMVPSALVQLDEIPVTPNGKVDRKALPAPDRRLSTEEAYAMPQSDIERSIAAIWQEVLHIDTVGVHDNFFDLGGHSLNVTQVQSLIKERLNSKISLVEMFKYPTVSALSKYLGQEEGQLSSFEKTHERAMKQREALKIKRKIMQN